MKINFFSPALCGLFFALAVSLSAAPVITEFMAAGQGVVEDEDGDFTDWLEITNPDPDTYLLTGHFLTDDPENLTKWPFPAGVRIQAGRHLLVMASRKDRYNIFAGIPHTSFALEANRGYLALVGPDQTVLSAYSNYPRQRVGHSFGTGSGGETGYFVSPTPDAPNEKALPAVV
ncbi:MAG: lamin tail domain-containing protein, partial [Verrucomicrobiota bacterium]